jgi:hypothetical protein
MDFMGMYFNGEDATELRNVAWRKEVALFF